MKKIKLSLCIATFNEEKNIHYPLDSAYDFVDEVIIVDGGSTDKTVEIAKSYGKKVRVVQSDNPAMFHKNKQKALDQARGEWIIQLDADEELSDDLKKEIKEKINNSKKSEIVAYWIPRKNWFLTKFLEKGGQYPDYTIRFYRRGYAVFLCRDVHENVEIRIQNLIRQPADKNKNEFIGYLNNPILHYADPDFSRYLKRWDRYTTLEAEILFKKIKNQKSKIKNFFLFIDYFIFKPKLTFFSMYFRHKGFMDGFAGFVFALFSSIRFWVIYIKWWKKINSS
ncbi:MAG: glycosyltransferase family 2 protein [Patescibacteria group bacterium]|nr:glycosyltransferase family 2 protein [Patescibacteria group bacterium]